MKDVNQENLDFKEKDAMSPETINAETAATMHNAKSATGKKINIARRVVQTIMLILFLVPTITAGFGVLGLWPSGSEQQLSTPAELPFFGSLSSSSVFGITLMDPFAMLQVLAASKAFSIAWLIGVLPVVMVYGLIKGRAFCGWVCPVNFILEGIDSLRKKLGLNVAEMPLRRHTKIVVAAVILVLSALLSFPVFEALSPISFINKGLVFGSLVGVLTFLAIVLAELFIGHRIWCRSLCPLGGFYELLGKAGLVQVKIKHEACISCQKCKNTCLCDPEILEPAIKGDASAVVAGDCMLCGKCIKECPTDALKVGLRSLKSE